MIATYSVPEMSPPEAALLETVLWEPDSGFFLLERHLARLQASAQALGFAVDVSRTREVLQSLSETCANEARRIRVTVARDGRVCARLDKVPPSSRLWVDWAVSPVDSRSGALRHKTTERGLYERARAARPLVDESLLWNERDEVTETTTGNVVAVIDGSSFTPPDSVGLLPGTYRGLLLEQGKLKLRVLSRADIERAERLYQINSVRKWCPLQLVRPAAA